MKKSETAEKGEQKEERKQARRRRKEEEEKEEEEEDEEEEGSGGQRVDGKLPLLDASRWMRFTSICSASPLFFVLPRMLIRLRAPFSLRRPSAARRAPPPRRLRVVISARAARCEGGDERQSNARCR